MEVAVPGYHIRPLVTPEEWRGCVTVQEAVWGAGFSERVPPAMMLVAHRLSGVVSGAFLEERDDPSGLVGIVFGLTGIDEDGVRAHWSDLLAVLPEHRGKGLSYALKAHQRAQLLPVGVERVYWTFDPLRVANAALNLNRLGARVREYRVDLYGDTGSPLHAGIGTDRFVALWEIDSERVRARMGRGAQEEREGGFGNPRPGLAAPSQADLVTEGPTGEPTFCPEVWESAANELRPVRVACPTHLDELLERNRAHAVAWREASRAAFRSALEAGYEVLALEQDRDDRVAHYRLEPRDDR